jgi:hypothetical protein
MAAGFLSGDRQSLGPTPMQVGNSFCEVPNLAEQVGGHRNLIRSTQRTVDFILCVLEHQWERRFETMAKNGFLKRHGIG